MRSYHFALLALLLFGDGAHAQVMFITYSVPPPIVGDYSHIQRVAILSSVGQSLSFERSALLGVTAQTVDASNWELDDYVDTATAELLSDRFSVVDVPYDRATLDAVPSGGLLNAPARRLREYLETLPETDVDAFVIIRAANADAPELIRGMSIASADGAALLRANYEIRIVDAQEYETLGQADSRVAQREGEEPGFVGRYASADLLPAEDAVPTLEQYAAMKEEFQEIVGRSLLETLRSLDTGVELPPVGARRMQLLTPEENPYAEIRTIAVVSAVADQLELIAGGMTRDEAQVPVPDWTIDDDIEAELERFLARYYTVAQADIDRTSLYQSRIFTNDGLRESYPELPANPALDAYVLVLKHPVTLFTNAFYSLDGTGVGVWHARVAFNGETEVYAHYAIAVVDAQTRELLRVTPGVTSPTFANPRSVPVDDGLWVAEPAGVTPDHLERYRQALMPLLADSLGFTSVLVGLTGYEVSNLPPTRLQDVARVTLNE